jgi:hypothetical protein
MSIRPEYRTLGNFLGVEERPATGQSPVTLIRLSDKMRESVDAWAGSAGRHAESLRSHPTAGRTRPEGEGEIKEAFRWNILIG